jgi:hypothetical protein
MWRSQRNGECFLCLSSRELLLRSHDPFTLVKQRSDLFVCVCVCVCACAYVCMYVCMYVYMYICMYVYVLCICMYVCMYVCMCVCVRAHACVGACARAYMCACVCLCVLVLACARAQSVVSFATSIGQVNETWGRVHNDQANVCQVLQYEFM